VKAIRPALLFDPRRNRLCLCNPRLSPSHSPAEEEKDLKTKAWMDFEPGVATRKCVCELQHIPEKHCDGVSYDKFQIALSSVTVNSPVHELGIFERVPFRDFETGGYKQLRNLTGEI
jgi:hypothetical protein